MLFTYKRINFTSTFLAYIRTPNKNKVNNSQLAIHSQYIYIIYLYIMSIILFMITIFHVTFN